MCTREFKDTLDELRALRRAAERIADALEQANVYTATIARRESAYDKVWLSEEDEHTEEPA